MNVNEENMMRKTIEDKLEELLKKNGGYLLTRDASSAGISRVSLATYVKKKKLIRASQGVYISEDAWQDELFLINVRSREVCFSHETALYLHHLMDREPSEYSVTVKHNYNGSNLRSKGIRVYRISDNLFPLGITEVKTPYGHQVRTYDRERTICDIIIRKEKMDIQVFQTAVKGYMKGKEKDVRKLMRYAAAMGIEDKVRTYTEVLL